MAFSGKMQITSKGLAKFQSFKALIRVEAQSSIIKGVGVLRANAASRAPGQREEAELVSQGAPGGAGKYPGGGIVGIPDGGRHIPEGPGVRTAILDSPIEVAPIPTGSVAWTGSAERINRAADFSWNTATRGRQGPTQPFNRNFLMALEEGGVWIVVPRTRALLNPEPGVTAGIMGKTIKPRHMFSSCVLEWIPVGATLAAELKAKLRPVGMN